MTTNYSQDLERLLALKPDGYRTTLLLAFAHDLRNAAWANHLAKTEGFALAERAEKAADTSLV